VPHLRSAVGGAELAEMDVDAVIRRAPELALVDELAHTNLTEARNRKRYEDIDDILAAGIAVTSTVNIQHLESLNDEVFELTGVRVRETFPDRILDEADEVLLVDLAPEALQERLRNGKVYPSDRIETALDNFFRLQNLAALRELVLRELAEDVEARRTTTVLDPLSHQAVAERILVLVTPEPRSQRILRRAFRSGQRLGSEIDAVWVRTPGQELGEADTMSLAALRRLASILGAHFHEVEGQNLPDAVKQFVHDHGSTYVFLGTPDESRRTEVLRGSLVSKLVRDLPGVDIRVVADRALRERIEP
jgi:two-component system sensor histidine kinase KdpD